jgi:hypothetical protein
MRTLAAAALVALVVLPAQAQMPGGKHRPADDRTRPEDKGPKIDEKAYKDALKRIPDSKEKYDPWSGARPSTDKASK